MSSAKQASKYSVAQSKSRLIEMRSFGIKIGASVPSDVADHIIRKSEIYLPIGANSNGAVATQSEIEIEVHRGNPRLLINQTAAKLITNGDEGSIAADTLLVTSRLLERQLNLNGVFCIHAGAVSYNGQAILLLGSYGSGKTTTAIHMCLSDDSVSYITGGRTFLDSKTNSILYGMDKVTLTASSIMDEFNEVRKDLPVELGVDLKRDPSQMIHSRRLTFSSSQFRIKRAQFPVQLGAIALLRKRDSELVAFKQEKPGATEIICLHSALCEYSEKGYVLLGPRLHFPDIFNTQTKSARLDYAEKLVNSVPIMYLEGRLGEMSRHLRVTLSRL